MNCCVPYFELKHIIRNFIKNKWQRDWNYQLNNKLQRIKPHISIWPSITLPKIDVILKRLRISLSKITHRYLLVSEGEPTCSHYHFSTLTIRHLLTDFSGLRYIYRYYFNTSSPNLTDLLGGNPHHELFSFLKKSKFLIWHWTSLSYYLLYHFYSLTYFLLLSKDLGGKPYPHRLFFFLLSSI